MKNFVNILLPLLVLVCTFYAFKCEQKEFQKLEAMMAVDTIPDHPIFEEYKLVWTGFSIHHYDSYSVIDGSLPHNEGYVVTVSDTSITSPLMGYMPIKWTSDSTMVYPGNDKNYNCTFTIHDNWSWIECKLYQVGELTYHAKLY
jgi:hypothetical protein